MGLCAEKVGNIVGRFFEPIIDLVQHFVLSALVGFGKKRGTTWIAWPVKSCQMSIKVTQNDFTRKMKDLDTFTKIAWKCGQFGQNSYCQGPWKVAQCGHTGLERL